MRPGTSVLSALACLAAAAAVSVSFFAVSLDRSIYGPISSIHEGAGTNYFLVTKGGSGEKFDLRNGVATTKQGPFLSYVGTSGPYLAAGPAVSPSTLRFKDDSVENYNFWACKNTYDPYLYSTKNHIIAVGKKGNNTAPFRECKLIKIVKVPTGGPNPSPFFPSPGQQNTTVNTTDITVTGYTTYCPTHTTVTITTCSNHRCAPTTITATTATTITITGECLVHTTVTHNLPASESSYVYTTHVTVTGYTTHVTVTGYTTYCPSSTFVTVTTCKHNCAPRIISVSKATTLTVSGEVLVSTTVTSVLSSTPYTISANSSFASIPASRLVTLSSITT